MIEINLLPEEMKKKKKKRLVMPDLSSAFMPISISVAALLILTHFTLKTLIHINNDAYSKMSKGWLDIKDKKESIELIKKENSQIRKRLENIDALTGKKVLWAKKLNELSDLIIPGIWFTKLSVGPFLNIEGEASAMYGEELAIIGKFIEQLKADKEFFTDFSNIELGSTQLHTIGEIEVMKFNINCYFKKPDR